MTTYVFGWGENDQDPSGQHTLRVTGADEVDAALDRISADGGFYQVDVYEELPGDDAAIPPVTGRHNPRTPGWASPRGAVAVHSIG